MEQTSGEKNQLTLQEKAARQFINRYPNDILELFIKFGKEKLAKENKQTIVISYNDEAMEIVNNENKRDLLIHLLHFLIDFDIYKNVDEYFRHNINYIMNIKQLCRKYSTSSDYDHLSNFQKLLEDKSIIITNEDLKWSNDVLINYFEWNVDPRVFDHIESQGIMENLIKYKDKGYEKYFIFAECQKYDYIAVYQDECGQYNRHEIGQDINEMNIWTDSSEELHHVYQVL